MSILVSEIGCRQREALINGMARTGERQTTGYTIPNRHLTTSIHKFFHLTQNFTYATYVTLLHLRYGEKGKTRTTKTKKHMGLATTNVMPMKIVGPSFPLESLGEYDSYNCGTGLCFTATIDEFADAFENMFFWQRIFSRSTGHTNRSKLDL